MRACLLHAVPRTRSMIQAPSSDAGLRLSVGDVFFEEALAEVGKFSDAADAEIGLYSPLTQSQRIFITSSATIRQSTRRNHSASATIVTTNEAARAGLPFHQASVPVDGPGGRRIVARQRSKRLYSSAASVAFMLFFVHHFVGVADVEHQIEPLRIKAVKHPLGKR